MATAAAVVVMVGRMEMAVGQSYSGFSSSGFSSNGNGGGSGFQQQSSFSSGGNGGFGGSSSGFSSGGGGNGGFSSGGGNGGFGGSNGFSSGGGSGGYGGSSGGGSEVTQGQTQVIDISGGSSGGGNVVYKNVVKIGEPIVTKHFYVHEAPEEEENARVEEKVQEIRPQKNYKIIFIKAPSQPNPFSPANIPQFPQNEEKTIVYVLSKKPEGLGENGEFPTPPPPVTSKPEVFFVKYKTKEEAEQAVAKIQDSFQEGGPGYNSPASFAESLGAQSGGASSSSFSSGSSDTQYRGDEDSLDVRNDGLQAPFTSSQQSQSQPQSQSQGDFNSEYLPPNKRQAFKRQARRQQG